MPFFSDTGPGGFQPKRKFRFLVNFSELSNLTFMAKSAAKPSYEMGSQEHNVLNHVFKFPGIVKWNDIDVTFIDAVDPNVGSKFYSALVASGYIPPVNEAALTTGVTKVNTHSTIGEVKIKQLDGGGVILLPGQDPSDAALDTTRVVDEWTLKNAFIKSVKFGDGLDYTSEDLVDISVSLTYDYATYSAVPGGLPLAQ